jgi:hypothetical protein
LIVESGFNSLSDFVKTRVDSSNDSSLVWEDIHKELDLKFNQSEKLRQYQGNQLSFSWNFPIEVAEPPSGPLLLLHSKDDQIVSHQNALRNFFGSASK